VRPYLKNKQAKNPHKTTKQQETKQKQKPILPQLHVCIDHGQISEKPIIKIKS
jgi:hypothetical protein